MWNDDDTQQHLDGVCENAENFESLAHMSILVGV